jgi:hypothetical protein
MRILLVLGVLAGDLATAGCHKTVREANSANRANGSAYPQEG